MIGPGAYTGGGEDSGGCPEKEPKNGFLTLPSQLSYSPMPLQRTSFVGGLDLV